MKRILCTALASALLLPAAYQYYYSDALTSINLGNWTQNGVLTATSAGLTSADPNGGSLISRIAVPDGTSEYEIRTTLNRVADGGTYIHYVRATSNARSGSNPTGTFYSVELQNPTIANGTCSVTLAAYRVVNGSVTVLGSMPWPCRDGMLFRTHVRQDGMFVSVDDRVAWMVWEIPQFSGQPGIGIANAPAGNTISSVALGPRDRTDPAPVNVQSVGLAAFPTEIDLQWQGASDGANGTGIWCYYIIRNNPEGVMTLYGQTFAAEWADHTVAPSTTYNYWITACDFSFNCVASATFTVTTPPAGAVGPRRTGVRPLGSYWGSSGEQIDIRSGNLNFTVPLLKALARGGWSVPFVLSYNSQSWRKDPGGTWKLGRDVGYGFGWQLLAGSITPYWTDWFTLHHFTYTDSSGAEYRLDVNTNGVWTSREGVYVWYDSNAQRLYFPDGSFWAMGAQSAGTEEDSGTLYPTTMQDSNGNQILVRYQAGSGAVQANTSARISQIEDYRAGYTPPRTFAFTYNGDPIPHLTGITNTILTGEAYTLSYTSNTLYSPFDPISFGATTLLGTLTTNGLNTSHAFSYLLQYGGTTGELTQAALPQGAHLDWTHMTYDYSGSRKQRGLVYRSYGSAPGSTDALHAFNVPLSGAEHVPAWTCITAPNNTGQRCWFFDSSTSSPYVGLVTSLEERPQAWALSGRVYSYAWTQDAAGRPYVAVADTYVDPYTAYALVSRTEQTLDVYGNVTQTRLFDYGAATPTRTYSHTYLNTSPYTSRYIFNRLTYSSVTPNGGGLVGNSYDSACGTFSPGMPPLGSLPLLDLTTSSYRGNVTGTSSLDQPYTCYARDETGNVRWQWAQDGTRRVASDTSGANYAAPRVITPNSNPNLATSLTYSSFMGVTSVTAPNGAAATTSYDMYGHPAQSSSPHGAATTYGYTVSYPFTATATTNGRWEKTTYDGFGRTTKVERGTGTETKSIVDSEYAPCACSPIGKLRRVSLPHAPGAQAAWTTYTYDFLGRTLSVQAPGNSTTTYLYQGNMTTVTDPAGKWKKFTTDALGHLTKVTEPNPVSPPVAPDGPTLDTTYTYDGFDNLATVTMTRSCAQSPVTGCTQVRTFTYSGRLLLSASNPEWGATSAPGTFTYTYNADYTLATRTDAKNQRFIYERDAYGRVTRLRACPAATCWEEWHKTTLAEYYYDTNPFDPAISENAWGRLTATAFQGEQTMYPRPSFTYMYGYTPGGLAKTRRLRFNGQTINSIDLDLNYTYDNEGRVLTLQYPRPIFDPQWGASGRYSILTYGYDSMGRSHTLSERITGGDPEVNQNLVTGVQYNVAGEALATSGMWSESRQYNSLFQLTRITGNGMDMEYRYSPTQNNGRITQQKDWVSGEEVSYTYDALHRLLTAETTGPEWGTRYGYDGFGNLYQKAVTKGSAPVLNSVGGGMKNRGESGWDANGNYLANGSYDYLNRLVNVAYGSGFAYAYAPDNKRVLSRRGVEPDNVDDLYLYGADGRKLATYRVWREHREEGWVMGLNQQNTSTYFAGKLIRTGNSFVGTDRLGSVMTTGYPINAAVGKAASQSSTLPGYPSAVASSAVDGNGNGNFWQGSVTHTNQDANAWWQVDLGGSVAVNQVVIWNRTDCCGDRLNDYWVFISDIPFAPSDTPATLVGRPNTWSSHQFTAPNPGTTIVAGTQGRYVRVQLSGTNYLSLTEVQVVSGGERFAYYPYGEERLVTPNNREKFGTYFRDDNGTGLDYADQRYYASTTGRFLTPDPYRSSASTMNPTSWNRYAYVSGDPINYSDRRGLFETCANGTHVDWGKGGGCWADEYIADPASLGDGGAPYVAVYSPGGGGGGATSARDAMLSRRDQYKETIYASSGSFKGEILDCMAGRESGWDPSAVDKSGDFRGMFQIGSVAWRDVNEQTGASNPYLPNVFDAQTSAVYAAAYLEILLKRQVGLTDYRAGRFDDDDVRQVLENYNGSTNKKVYASSIMDCAKKISSGDIPGGLTAIGRY